MRLGVVTPVLTRLPGAHARWEESAGIAEVARVAEEAERLGYHHLTCSEHIGIPRDVAAVRGATYWDPLATFGYLAARTATIRLATFVLVLGYHHPLAIAKRYGTLDRVCDGRLILGVGVGSLEEEFALLDAPFAGRGERGDDAIRALRAALARPEPEYHGTHYEFSGFVIDPHAVQAEMPIWIGGQSARSLRRAVELADGWAPFGLRTDALDAMVERARATDAWQRRSRPLDLILQNERPLDPAGDPERAAERVERFRRLGTTVLNVRFVHHSLEHYLEQLGAMAEIVSDGHR
ncbi:MAG TPA: TIGR03619 family F420-dependent LLM class oxidoreductase [Acidimicrobiia bacterium]